MKQNCGGVILFLTNSIFFSEFLKKKLNSLEKIVLVGCENFFYIFKANLQVIQADRKKVTLSKLNIFKDLFFLDLRFFFAKMRKKSSSQKKNRQPRKNSNFYFIL